MWVKLPRELTDRDLMMSTASNTQNPMLMGQDQMNNMIGGKDAIQIQGADQVFAGLGNVTSVVESEDSDDEKDEKSGDFSSDDDKKTKKEERRR